ncbi:MAG: hypothetical protein WDO14_16475 [Bacteroidota bacterium]
MSTSDLITLWSIAVGLFVTIIGSALMIMFKIGGFHEKVLGMDKHFEGRFHGIENTIDKIQTALKELTATVNQIRIEITEIQVKLDILWRQHTAKSNSPLSLNEEGLRALKQSNIGAFADHHYPEFLSKVKALKPENAYQAQELLISVVSRYKKADEHKLHLPEAAFSSGSDVDSLLFVAALSVRDRLISDLAFN